MKISLNLLRQFVEIPTDSTEIANVLTSLGFEVEEIFDLNEKYKNFVVGEVKSCEKVTEKLSFCRVSDGANVVDVICGAPNVAQGQKVVLALPGAVIPKNKLEIKPTVIRGINSTGMICSEDELEIGDCADKILVLPLDAPVGIPFANYFELNDVVYEIAITPNRGDCLSHLGIARELSAYYHLPLKVPAIDFEEDEKSNIGWFVEVEVLDSEKCPRYSARVVCDVEVVESPQWMKSKLIALGLRPINVVVDVTNYVMMELGQPLHAFDYDRLTGKKIIVRTASEGEKFVTLDGKERELDSTMLMICDANRPVAIGGVMGGENSEITKETRNVLLESAFFSPTSIRRTSKKLGLVSESSYRFERGVDYGNVVFALNRAAQLIAHLTNGKIVKDYIDVYPKKIENKYVPLRFQRVSWVLGIDIEKERIFNILTGLGFKIFEQDGDKVVFQVPTHRFDVEQEIDLIEEIARFVGYDNIPEDRSYSITFSGEKQKTPLDVPEVRQEIKNYFVFNGFQEILTQNLYNPNKMRLFYDGEFIEIANPLGEEYSIVRASSLAPVLEVAKYNINIGRKDFRIFEIGKEFRKNNTSQGFIEGIEEKEVLSIAVSGLSSPLQWGETTRLVDFYDIKGIFEHFLSTFSVVNFEIEPTKHPNSIFGSEAGIIKIDGRVEGEFGVVSKELKKVFDIDQDLYFGYLNLRWLYSFTRKLSKYAKISPFPVVRRDLAFVVDEGIPAGEILELIWKTGGDFLRNVVIFDVYKGKNIGSGKKNLAFALFFNSNERTLTEEEVNAWIQRIVETIQTEKGAELRVF
jgi:phenylalanyl-tRNA synthetase beta chain